MVITFEVEPRIILTTIIHAFNFTLGLDNIKLETRAKTLGHPKQSPIYTFGGQNNLTILKNNDQYLNSNQR